MGFTTGRRAATTIALALTLTALSGCGDATDEAQEPASDPSSTSSPESSEPEESEPSTEIPANAPQCLDVWADGSPLPRTYRGCVDDAGAYVERDAVGCSSGQRLVIFDDAYWGVLGGTVNEAQESLDSDRDYRAATRRCAA